MNKQHALLLALLVSVAVNLLVLGVVLGRQGQRPPEPPPAEWATRHLDDSARRLVRQRMSADRGRIRPLRADVGEALAEVRRAAVAEEFDAVALEDALENMRDARARYEAFLHRGLVSVAAQLPREQRLALLRAALEPRRDNKRGGRSKAEETPGIKKPSSPDGDSR